MDFFLSSRIIAATILFFSSHIETTAQGIEGIACDIPLEPYSKVLVESTKKKIKADPSYAESYKELDDTIAQATEATRRALAKIVAEMHDVTDPWNARKSFAPALPDGRRLALSRDGIAYDLTNKVPIDIDISAYDWSNGPTWEDFLDVKSKYDPLLSEYNELVGYYCKVLVPGRNKVIPFEQLSD